MFLLKSHSDTFKEDKSLQLEMLKASAEKGYIPAQAVIERVQKSYGIAFNGPSDYLANGAATGSIYAMLELASRDSQSAEAARMRLFEATGYNQFFSPLPASFDVSQDATDADGNTLLHRLSARGNITELQRVLRDQREKMKLNSRNRHGETALYKACLTGCWQTVSLLYHHGAKASIPSHLNGLTCLHWLFNFPHGRIDEVAKTLVRSGANVNATAHSNPTEALIDYHFPFQWPLGTPLHSAVHTRNRAAVRALMSRGADASIRDIRDPYVIDLNVRQMHVHGMTETGESSRPDHTPLGFTPVDLAAALHDGEILELLALNGKPDTSTLFRANDEEGYTPFHRLSYLRIGRTSDGLRFWYPALRGSATDCEAQIANTIRVLKRLGGNINQLTNTPDRPALQGASGLTPLMIAVSKADCEVAYALLKAGAKVDLVNRDGTSALMCLPHASDSHVTPGSLLRIVHMLRSAGANANLKSIDDTTALIAAVNSDSMPCVQALVDNGADPSASQRGFNIVASLVYHSGYLRQLAAPDAKSRDEAERRERDIVAILMTICSSEHTWAHRVDMDNGSLLHYAASAGLVDCVKVLVQAGFDRTQQRKLHFSGRIPPYYNSTPACMRQQGTPFEVTCQAEAHLATQGMNRISQQGRSVDLRLCPDIDELTIGCRPGLHSTKVLGHQEFTGDLMTGDAAYSRLLLHCHAVTCLISAWFGSGWHVCSTWGVHFDERTADSVDLFNYLLFLSCVSRKHNSPALKAYT
jgi:ankyrin repeat protein